MCLIFVYNETLRCNNHRWCSKIHQSMDIVKAIAIATQAKSNTMMERPWKKIYNLSFFLKEATEETERTPSGNSFKL